MSRSIAAGFVLAVALVAGGSTSAFAWGWDWWWDRCDYRDYTCYGPPYGNTEPPSIYVYDHNVGPTWTGNGWAYLPVGQYRPGPPVYAPPPPPPAYYDDDHRDRRPHWRPRPYRPMK